SGLSAALSSARRSSAISKVSASSIPAGSTRGDLSNRARSLSRNAKRAAPSTLTTPNRTTTSHLRGRDHSLGPLRPSCLTRLGGSHQAPAANRFARRLSGGPESPSGGCMAETATNGPLAGIRVLDFTQFMQGPWATQLLGDMGADVVKVEPPAGDWERGYTFDDVWPGGDSALFLAMNRNKRSIVVNLKSDTGRELALRLAAGADVIVENARPGVMDRLGVGYEHVRAVNPSVVYASATGYGSSGPYRDRPGQDLLIQAPS